MVENEHRNGWDEQSPHIEIALKTSANAATGLAPNDVRLGRLPRSAITVIQPRGVTGHQGRSRDRFEYHVLAGERQQRGDQLVREYQAIVSTRTACANQEMGDIIHKRLQYAVGNRI